MTNVKKVVAILLAFLMIFSSASVFASAWDASADDGYSLNIETKFFKQVNGEWVETTKVKRGETVEARVYLGTDYYSNDSTLLFFYDKDFFTHEYTATPVEYTASSKKVVNGDSDFVTANSVTARVAADPSLSTLINNNYIDQAFADKYGAISAVVKVGSANNVMYDNSTYTLAFTLKVADNASGEGDFFVKDTTVQSADRKRATVNVPKGPADGTDADLWAMRLWDADVTLNSQPVSTQSSVTFNANTGIFANDEETYVAKGFIDSVIDATKIPAVTKDGYAFMGWINAADTTPTYEETISAPATIPENDLVLNAYWMETVDITVDAAGGYFDGDTTATKKEFLGVAPYAEFAEVAQPVKDGYTFVGWDVRGNMDLPANYPDADATYTAVWAKDVVVSFNTNGAGEIAPIAGVAGEDFTAVIDDPAKAGYYFIGWSPALPTVFPEQDTTYTAEFEAYSYNVEYYVDGVRVAQTQLEYGMVIPTVVPIFEVTTGMKLDGWYTDASFTTSLPAGATMPALQGSNTYRLYAKTTPETYDAIFTVDGNVYAEVPTVYDTKIVAPGDEGSAYNVPAKEGYVFAGWDPYPGTMDQANDMYFEAIWTEAVNTLTYVVDGGVYEQFTEENGIAFGMDLEVPSDPDKEGYTFLGWAETADATEAIKLPEKMPADNMTYYAVFKINTYNVTFNTADGAFADDSTELTVPYEFNADVAKPEVPTKTGYTFSAWVDDETGVKYDANTAFPKMIAKDVSYTAEYTVNNYTATWKFDNGEADKVETYAFGATIVAPEEPTKTGYTFDGWSPEVDETMPANNVTYTAQWKVNSYTATWVFDNGEADKVETYAFGATIVAPEEPTKTGYTFDGWSPEVDETMPANSVTYTAQWKVNSYNATFISEGVTVEEKSYNYNTAVNKPANDPVKTGYTFVAWVGADNTEYDKNTALPVMGAADVTYTAKFEINSYTATWVFDNGSEDKVETYVYGTAITAPADPEKTGYTFNGWSPAVDATMPANNVTYTAQWKVNNYTVTWKFENGSEDKVDTYAFGATIVAPADPEKTGYSFTGWSPAVDTTMPAQNIEYTATWDANSYDAIFDANGGKWTDGDTTKIVPTAFDSKIIPPSENPEMTGFVFNGWEPEVGTMDNVNGLTFTAKWENATDTMYTVNIHTMNTEGGYDVSTSTPRGETNAPVDVTPKSVEPGFKFNAEKSIVIGNIKPDGTLVLDVYIDRETYTFTAIAGDVTDTTEGIYYGATVVMPDEVEKVGYIFDGWYDGDTKYAAGALTEMPIGGLTVEAKWTADEVPFKVVVNYNDAATGVHAEETELSGTSDYTIKFVDEIPEIEAENTIYLVKSDFAVDHYTLDEAASDLEGTVAPEGTTVLNLYYTANKYVITFDSDIGAFTDGDEVKTVELAYNTLVKDNLPENPVKAGYTFKGWIGLSDTIRVVGNRTFPADFQADPQTITWVIDDGKTQVQNYVTDAVITVPNAGTKAGHIFRGWSEVEGGTTPAEIPTNMPAESKTYYAIWEIQQYTVTFYQEKGSDEVVFTTTADYGTEYDVPVAEKIGHTFANWLDVATDTAVSFKDGKATIPAENTEYYATWTINKYKFTFDSNEGTVVAPIEQNFDTAITAPAAPTKEGYEFLGWSLTDGENAVVEALPEKMPAEDRTYYAVWEENDYTITFDADNGTQPETVTQDYLSSVAAPAAPVKDGYTFEGWATTKGVTNPAQKVSFPVTMPLGGTTYYAIWVANNYTITFNNGTEATTVTQAYGTSVAAPAAPTKEGYTFGGWSATEGGTDAVTFPVTMPLNGAEYFAIWNVESYNVTWVSLGVTEKAETVNYGAALDAPEITRNGYTLSKWTDANGNTAPATMNDIGNNGASVTYTAVWTANEYNAVFNAGDGEWAGGVKTQTVPTLFDQPIIPPEVPERDGYNFNGWEPEVGNMTEEGMIFNATWLAKGGITYTVITYTMGTDREYTAVSKTYEGVTDTKVNVKPSTVAEGFKLNDAKSTYEGTVTADGKLILEVYIDRETYQFNTSVTGGTTTDKVEYLYGATVVVPAEETKEGYTFNGWYDGSTKYAAGASFEMPARNVTLTGWFDINSYTATWVFDNGTADKVETYVYGTAITAPTGFVKEGYTFDGWSPAVDATMPANNVTFTAQWKANTYTITFDSNGGSAVENIVADFGIAITAPANPVREGYTFAGWYVGGSREEGGTKTTVPSTMPLNGMVLTAAWDINSYMVTFYETKDSTKILKQTSINYGVEMSAPVATMEGYTLDKWVDADTGIEYTSEEIANLATPAKAVNFYATWTLNSHTVNFRANNGIYADNSANKAIAVEYGKEVVAPEIPTRAGYTFIGWMDNATRVVYAVGETLPVMIDEDVVYVAQWKIETYTVSWISDGKEVTGDEFSTSAKYGDEFTSPDMEKKGYTFNGWSYDNTTYPAGESIVIGDAGDNGAAITITADWSANEYVATFNANGGTWADGDVTKNVPTFFDAEIIAPEQPTRAGYTFNGWEPEVGYMTEENMTFNATWLANGGITYTVITYTMGTDGNYGEGVSKTYEGVTDETVNVKPESYAEGFKQPDNDISVYEGKVEADGSLVLTVYIARQSYTVTTTVDGEVKATDTVLYGAEVTVPALEVKEGYTFSGWSVDGTKYEANATFAMPAKAVEIAGTFTVNQYDAKFYVDGQLFDTVSTDFGKVPVAPDATNAKPGYTFKNWDPALTEMVVGGAEYNAVFEANTDTAYTVEIYEMDVNGVYGEATETLNKTGTTDTEATFVPETREGFTAETVSGKIEADGSLVLKVYYERQKFNVIYKVDGEQYGEPEEYYFDEDVDATLEEPTKEGYSFSGWSAQAPAKMPANDVVIEGTFSINTYTITYMVDGEQHKVESYEYGADVTALAEPTKEGYTFSGWDKAAPAKMPAENLVISGTFTVNQYDAKFYVDGNVIATVPTDFDKVPVAPDVTNAKPGYTFINWNPALVEMVVGGADYHAVFEAKDGIVYKVETYKMTTEGAYELADTEEFTGIAGDTAKYAVKDYEGFTFVSGTNYDAETNTVSGAIKGDGTTVLEVRYSRDKINVSINGEEGKDYYYGEEIPTPEAPKASEGMEHTGWVDEDGNEVEFPYTVPTDENDEIIITPVFTPINYLVTFVSDGATVEAKEVAYGSKIEAPSDPTKAGYMFMGWANEKGEYLKADTTMPAKAVTYTAVFEITTSDVVYYVDGAPVGAVSCEYGQVISTVAPGYTVPMGYSLSAWYTDVAYNVLFVEGTTYGSGVTKLYAKTTANEYKAVFNADGGEFADGTDTYEVMVAFDSKITAPADPTREGYDFLGWDPMVGTMDEEGMIFTAIWAETVDFYTITYYVDYVDETTKPYEVFNVTFGEDFEAPSEPDKAGWKFLGWSTDPNATAGEELPAKMPAENLVYYAIFERSAATVTFYDYEALTATPYKGEQTSTTADVNFKEKIEFPANSAIDSRYWTFLGWSETEGGEVIDTSNIILDEGIATEYYAVYKKVTVKLVPKAGSTTVIERTIGTKTYKESYASNNVTDVPYENVSRNFTKYFIYGLKVGQRETVLNVNSANGVYKANVSSVWLDVLGDGYAVATPIMRNRLGTGTRIDVYDNADTTEPVETFYVVIFGDINGDSIVNSTDGTLLNKEIVSADWAKPNSPTRVEYKFKAANLSGDRLVNSTDGTLLGQVVSQKKVINQETGKTANKV